MTDLSKCPSCGGEADNGFDRCFPPNPYNCKKCHSTVTPQEAREALEDFENNVYFALRYPENDKITRLKYSTELTIRRLLEERAGSEEV